MSEAPTTERRKFDIFVMSTPIKAPLSVLQMLTDAQVDRVGILVEGFKPASVLLYPDDFASDTGNVLFLLKDRAGARIYNGLIEPDGRAHT